jgi:hypothetical protein
MTKKKSTGFAAMDPERRRELARSGGRRAHELGHAYRFTPEVARSAGRKGGAAVSEDAEHMAEIGRKGGEARAAKRASALADQAAPST